MEPARCPDTVVLSDTYLNLGKVHWTKAFALVCAGKVEVLEEHEAFVRSAHREHPIPALIRYIRPVPGLYRKRRRLQAPQARRFSREAVFARDEGRCQYCGCGLTKREFTLDHVVPRCQGGITEWHNIVVCCTDCNRKKGKRRPEACGLKLRKQPAFPPNETRPYFIRG